MSDIRIPYHSGDPAIQNPFLMSGIRRWAAWAAGGMGRHSTCRLAQLPHREPRSGTSKQLSDLRTPFRENATDLLGACIAHPVLSLPDPSEAWLVRYDLALIVHEPGYHGCRVRETRSAEVRVSSGGPCANVLR